MGRKLDIPWIGEFKCHGNGGQNSRSRGVNISCVGGLYTMGSGVDIPWEGGSI